MRPVELLEEGRRMRALVCRAWGPVEDLRLEDVPAPVPAADEVLIEVKATAVNYADSIMVAGHYQTKPEFPFSPGLETAGVIKAVGGEVSRFRPGDRVMATLVWSNSTRCSLPSLKVWRLPS